MKKTTLKRVFNMLRAINPHSAFLYLEVGNSFVSFPHHRFKDYDDYKDLLQQDVDYTKERINLLCKKNNLQKIEIVNLKDKGFTWSQKVNLPLKELDDYLLGILNDIITNKLIKEI